jgi:PST family polysaccharide transporter
VLVGFVMGAMGQDYYPRLTALIHKKDEASHLIQDQTEMAVLLAAPILICVSCLSPWLLKLAYSEHFVMAAPAVTWLALGCLGRVVSWPLGYALLAEGKSLTILIYEALFCALSIVFAWIGVRVGGVEGAAAGFAFLYLLHWVVMAMLIRRRIGFVANSRLIGLVMTASFSILLGLWIGPWAGVALSLAATIYSARTVLRHLGPNHRVYVLVARLKPLAYILGLKLAENPTSNI